MGSGQKAWADEEAHAEWLARIEKSKQIVAHMSNLKDDTVLLALREIHSRIAALSNDVPMNRSQRYSMRRMVESFNTLVPETFRFDLELL